MNEHSLIVNVDFKKNESLTKSCNQRNKNNKLSFNHSKSFDKKFFQVYFIYNIQIQKEFFHEFSALILLKKNCMLKSKNFV